MDTVRCSIPHSCRVLYSGNQASTLLISLCGPMPSCWKSDRNSKYVFAVPGQTHRYHGPAFSRASTSTPHDNAEISRLRIGKFPGSGLVPVEIQTTITPFFEPRYKAYHFAGVYNIDPVSQDADGLPAFYTSMCFRPPRAIPRLRPYRPAQIRAPVSWPHFAVRCCLSGTDNGNT